MTKLDKIMGIIYVLFIIGFILALLNDIPVDGFIFGIVTLGCFGLGATHLAFIKERNK